LMIIVGNFFEYVKGSDVKITTFKEWGFHLIYFFFTYAMLFWV
jgi:hypothetical protein